MVLGLPQFCSLVLCFLTINTNIIASEGSATDWYSDAECAAGSRRINDTVEMSEVFYRSCEFIENIQVSHINDVCQVTGRVHAAHGPGATFPHCSVGHAN